MEIFNSTLTQMLVLFTFIAVGFFLRKNNLLPEESAGILSKLETYFIVPALIIESFSKNFTQANLSEHYELIIYSAILMAVALAISIPLSKVFGRLKGNSNNDPEYQSCIYAYALTFGNFGYMGNALALGVLGEEGLFLHLLFIIVLNIAVYTWGFYILIPKNASKGNPLKNLLTPPVLSLGIGMILGIFNLRQYMPVFITTTLGSAQACMGPIAMILLGIVVGSYNFKELVIRRRVYIATLLRLIIIPALMLIVLNLLHTPKLILTLVLFSFASPLGLNTVVFPAAYGADAKTGASMAMISHTLAVITLPLMYLAFIA